MWLSTSLKLQAVIALLYLCMWWVFCRRQQHFDSNHATCANTVVNMLPSVFQAVMEHFDTGSITAQLRTDPDNKLFLWNQLKTASKYRHTRQTDTKGVLHHTKPKPLDLVNS